MEHGNTILNITQGVAYIMELQQNDLLFHFDDDPKDCLGDKITVEEGIQIGNRMEELFALDWGVFECPHGFVLWVCGEGHRNLDIAHAVEPLQQIEELEGLIKSLKDKLDEHLHFYHRG